MAKDNPLARPASQPQGISSSRTRRRLRGALMAVALTLAFFAVAGGITYYVLRPVTLRIAVGPPNSDDVKVVQGLSQAFARDHAYIRLRPVITEGAAQSAADLAQGKTDLAIVRGDIDLPKNAGTVAYLRKNFVVIWVPGGGSKKSRITGIKQLAGKTIGIIGRSRANINLLHVILDQSGVAPDSVRVSQFATAGISEALRATKLDAYMTVGPLNSRITAEAIAATSRAGSEPRFLSLDTAEAIAQKYAPYDSGEIPAGTFNASPPRPNDTVTTITVGHYFMAQRSLSDTKVAAFARQLFGARQAILNEFPQSAKIETPDTDKDAAIPAHPGAAAFVDGEERSFLDRYSDYIWGGIMLLSVMGSLGAWFSGRIHKDERITNSGLRERLLEMLPAARTSNSIEELDAMQTEADTIMRETLHCFEDGIIEEGSLTAFSIALEQFHNAVADRKIFLINLPEKTRGPRSAPPIQVA